MAKRKLTPLQANANVQLALLREKESWKQALSEKSWEFTDLTAKIQELKKQRAQSFKGMAFFTAKLNETTEKLLILQADSFTLKQKGQPSGAV